MADQSVDEMEGVEATGAEPKTPLMTEDERRVLDVYDRLEELQLEITLLKAQGLLSKQAPPSEVTEKDINTAQDEFLNARAIYQIRNSVIANVLVANPIIKAVHAGQNGSAVEQDLLPLLQKRDTLSVTLTTLSKSLLQARNQLTKLQTENVLIGRKNAKLAKTMLALAHESNVQRKEDVGGRERKVLEGLEKAMGVSRQRWRIIKGTAAAVVVGSGVDWARDPGLLGVVLDDEG